MQKLDLPTLVNQLNLLAEVYEKKPVSEKAALVWFDTMREFPIHAVMDFLVNWPKSHSKFPVPSDVWRVVNERMIDQRETNAKAMKAQEKREVEQWVKTKQGALAIEAMRKTLGLPSRYSPQELDAMEEPFNERTSL